MPELYQSLSHSKWDCKYHIVFVPKRRRKVIFGQTRRHLGLLYDLWGPLRDSLPMTIAGRAVDFLSARWPAGCQPQQAVTC